MRKTNNFFSAGCATAYIISSSKNCHVMEITWFLMANLCILLVRRHFAPPTLITVSRKGPFFASFIHNSNGILYLLLLTLTGLDPLGMDRHVLLCT